MVQFRNKNCCIFESALFKTTSSVLWTNDLLLVVDPTWLPHEVAEIERFTQKIKGNRPVFLLFTHSDYDHILGYGAFPDATVIASKAFVDQPDKTNILAQIEKFDQDYYIDRPYQSVYPKVDIIIERSEQKLTVGSTEMMFYLAPGHNSDGIFTFMKPLGIWIVGDYLSNVEFPYIYHSYKAYEESLKTGELIMEEHQPKMLIPGHGLATRSTQEMEKRIAESWRYLGLLKKSVQNEEPFPEKKLWERYRFPRGMKAFHENNLALVKKELLTKNSTTNV